MPYDKRIYRHFGRIDDLTGFEIKIQQTDLYILADTDLSEKTEESILKYRRIIESYIAEDKLFAETLEPCSIREDAPDIIKDMASSAKKANVGPMAAVAGAVSEYVGKDLLNHSEQVIIENGGDIFIKSSRERKIGLYTDNASIDRKLILKIKPAEHFRGICTSSGKIGPSLSLGKADAVTVLSASALVADAVATAVGNIVSSSQDIEKGIAFARKIPEVKGVLIVVENNIGIWGDVELAD